MVMVQLEASSPVEACLAAESDVLPWADPYIVRLLSSPGPNGEPARGPRSPIGVHRPDEPRPLRDLNRAERGTRARPKWDCRSAPA